jgi:hypothetical protein
MRGFIPKRPTGSTASALFMQAVWDQLWSERGRFCDTATVKVRQTGRGFFWDSAAGGGGAPSTIAKFTYIRSFSEYVLCNDQNNNPVQIIKPPELCGSIDAAMIDGALWTYDYETAGDLAWVARSGTTSGLATPERQRIRRPWQVQDDVNGIDASIVYAMPYTLGDVVSEEGDDTTDVGTTLTLIAYSEIRVWVRKDDQTTP